MTDTQDDHYILFSVAGTSYAIPSRQVAHVEMIDQITAVPNAAPFVDGVVFSRGQVVPAINMRARFGFPRVSADLRTRLLVVVVGARSVGLLVDACREFLTIPPASIQPPGEALSGSAAPYLGGIATIDDRLIVMLNVEDLITSAGPLASAEGREVPGDMYGNAQAH
jgi:chemotaxis signal transduction protein